MLKFSRFTSGLAALLFLVQITHAEIIVVDDTGQSIVLSTPATRVISLAPNVTEILFHVGAGEQTVGAVDYSDFPPSALDVPRIGSSNQFNLETILALEPDLIVAWESGNPAADIRQLEDLGLPVFKSEPRTLNDIASLIRNLGILTGHPAIGEARAAAFLKGTAKVRAEYETRRQLRVFYQIWHDPIYTLNGNHLVSRLIEHCGGSNIFFELETLAPVVTTESVIERNPEVIIAGGFAGETPNWLSNWTEWSSIHAVQSRNLYTVDTDRISRMGPRILLGMQELCDAIEQARN